MKDNDYIAKLLTGRELKAVEKGKEKGKELRKEAKDFGWGYFKY